MKSRDLLKPILSHWTLAAGIACGTCAAIKMTKLCIAFYEASPKTAIGTLAVLSLLGMATGVGLMRGASHRGCRLGWPAVMLGGVLGLPGVPSLTFLIAGVITISGLEWTQYAIENRVRGRRPRKLSPTPPAP